MAVVFNGENVGIAFPIERQDRLQWKCDNMKSLRNEFQNYQGEGLGEVLQGLDTSKVENFEYFCHGSSFNGTLSNFAFDSAKTLSNSFYNCINAVANATLSGLGNVTTFENAFYRYGSNDTSSEVRTLILNGVKSAINMVQVCNGTTFKEIHINGDTSLVTKWDRAFGNNRYLETLDTLDLLSCTSNPGLIFACYNLKNLIVKNVRYSLPLGKVGGGNEYGGLLTDESLINTAKELWDLTGSTIQTLTVSVTSELRFDAIYVKLITATDEMIAEDPYINNKKPCVVCESTDEDAMTLREYVVSKNWALA